MGSKLCLLQSKTYPSTNLLMSYNKSKWPVGHLKLIETLISHTSMAPAPTFRQSITTKSCTNRTKRLCISTFRRSILQLAGSRSSTAHSHSILLFSHGRRKIIRPNRRIGREKWHSRVDLVGTIPSSDSHSLSLSQSSPSTYSMSNSLWNIGRETTATHCTSTLRTE